MSDSPFVLSLGSNLGDRAATLQAAVDALQATPGIRVTRVSRVYETDPVEVTDQPDFLNLVVVGRTTLEPEALLARGLSIEDAAGRVRRRRKGPRTLDVDVIALGETVAHTERLTLPHPAAHERAFVLVPWLDADPEASLVGHGRVRDLVAQLDATGVRPSAEGVG